MNYFLFVRWTKQWNKLQAVDAVFLKSVILKFAILYQINETYMEAYMYKIYVLSAYMKLFRLLPFGVATVNKTYYCARCFSTDCGNSPKHHDQINISGRLGAKCSLAPHLFKNIHITTIENTQI